jgi:hypothetical protein
VEKHKRAHHRPGSGMAQERLLPTLQSPKFNLPFTKSQPPRG